MNKHVAALSGGEKARLALAKLMLEQSNTLVLDEPTNHLDLDSKEVLENALDDFPGTILFVSHDRYFINRIATKIIEVETTGTMEYLGDYDYFVEKKQELAEIQAEKQQQIEKILQNLKNKPKSWIVKNEDNSEELRGQLKQLRKRWKIWTKILRHMKQNFQIQNMQMTISNLWKFKNS